MAILVVLEVCFTKAFFSILRVTLLRYVRLLVWAFK
jgi:hypothetical protein